MSGMTHPVLGEVEVDDAAGPSWRASTEMAGHPVVLTFAPGDAPLDPGQLDTLAGVAERLTELDRSARAALLRDYVDDFDSEGAGGYLIHHVEELGEATVAAALGVAAPLDAERFVGALRLVHVAVGLDDPAEPMVLDYTIGEDLTNYVLAVGMDADGQVIRINTES